MCTRRFYRMLTVLVCMAGATTLPLFGLGPRGERQDGPANQIRLVLDDFHDAASKADFERYIGHMASDSVFIGTDATERWTREAFAAFVKPYFEKGTGWTYVPRDRHIQFVAEGRVACFDELLDNAKYGECRGTGVLLQDEGGSWRIAQYVLTIPIPNGIAGEVVAMIRASRQPPSTVGDR